MIVITKTYLVDPDLVDSIVISCLLLLIKADSNYKVCQWINASGLKTRSRYVCVNREKD